MKKNIQNGNIYLVVAFMMMLLLFWSSSQTYTQQSQLSTLDHLLKNEPFKEGLSSISFQYAGNLISIDQKGYVPFIEFLLRKFAHFFTYFILGSSFYLGLVPKLQNIGLAALFGWLSATGYAGLDEFHQMLTGGRTPLFQDVVLDSCGALIGIFLCSLFLLVKKKRK